MRIVILSAGAESVSLAVAEALWSAGYNYRVIAMCRSSLLRGLPGCHEVATVWDSELTHETAVQRVGDHLIRWGASESSPIVVFPTEDDGLRVLHGVAAFMAGAILFSHGRAVEMGGLDKGRLFRCLQQAGLGAICAPTIELVEPGDIDTVIASYGLDVVVKPAYKPWGQSLDRRGTKVVGSKPGESPAQLRRRLADHWGLCPRWVAQPRLSPLHGAERSVCLVRSADGTTRGCQVTERLKYPRAGGSAAWVSSHPDAFLFDKASRIAEAIDLAGMAELSFLADSSGHPRLLEVNTRPWLQLRLVEAAGFHIINDALDALQGRSLPEGVIDVSELDWIDPERTLLSIITGDCGSRLSTVRELMREIAWTRAIYGVYSSNFPRVRRRWIRTMLGKLIRFH